jgi:hypothetical protein
MFSFFKSIKKAEIKFLVYFTKIMKYQQLIKRLKSEKASHTLLYYFDETKMELEKMLEASGLEGFDIQCAFDYTSNGSSLILVEVHPLATVTDQLLTRLAPETSLECYIGMDEGLMKLFGSERTIKLMEKMGMQQDEVISHSLVTGSIRKAQSKLDQKNPHPRDVRESLDKWIIDNKVDQMAL